MAASPDPHLVAGARGGASLGLALSVIGPSILLISAWVEVLNRPGLSLVDGYWIGRLPWTVIGVVIALAGSVASLLAGSLLIAMQGGWWRRFLIFPALAAGAVWWLIALGVLPYIPRFSGPDPVTFAYSLPSTGAILLLMPAALLATVALTPRAPAAPRIRLVPVPSAETPPRPRWDDEEPGAP